MSKIKKTSTQTRKFPHTNSVVVSLSSNKDERREQKKLITTLLRKASYYSTEGTFKRIGKTTDYSLNAGVLDKQLIRQIQNNLSRVSVGVRLIQKTSMRFIILVFSIIESRNAISEIKHRNKKRG